MDEIKEFVDYYNNILLLVPPKIQLDRYTDDVKHSIKHQLSLSKRIHTGISELGKPAVLLGMKKLGYKDREQTLKNIFRCHLGDVFESLLLESFVSYLRDVLLSKCDLSFQNTVEFKGYEGHIDCVLDNKLIIEVKTMNSYYWSKFTKHPDDEKGYITQLALYSEALNLSAVWLCLNIETYELKLVELTEVSDDLIQDKINRAVAVINALANISNFEELFETLAAPQPETEFFKKQPTGKFLIPNSMKYSHFADVFYVLKEEKNGYGRLTKYVEDYANYEQALKQLNHLYEVPF